GHVEILLEPCVHAATQSKIDVMDEELPGLNQHRVLPVQVFIKAGSVIRFGATGRLKKVDGYPCVDRFRTVHAAHDEICQIPFRMPAREPDRLMVVQYDEV